MKSKIAGGTLAELPTKKYEVFSAFVDAYKPVLRYEGYEFSTRMTSRGEEWDYQTTRLSNQLASNSLSMKEAWEQCVRIEHGSAYQRQLMVRDFFAQHDLSLNSNPVLREWKSDPWKIESLDEQNKRYQAWRNGRTGCDIVDASMLQLADTGFISNRQRMMCASYLSKNLLVWWRRGEEYFADVLDDYHPPSNLGNWAWVSGAGFNQRLAVVLSPDNQTRLIDPEGTLRAKYLRGSRRASLPAVQEATQWLKNVKLELS